MSVGYIVASHVVHQRSALPRLLGSMANNKIEPSRIVVVVNGCGKAHGLQHKGILHVFCAGQFPCQFQPVVNLRLGESMGVSHWFYLNATSKCGPRFKELAEGGFDPEIEATLASSWYADQPAQKRASVDLAMYRDDFLCRIGPYINSLTHMAHPDRTGRFSDAEGMIFHQAATIAAYANLGAEVHGYGDVYGSGTVRRTTYFPAVDWYRYVKYWGQAGGTQRPGL